MSRRLIAAALLFTMASVAHAQDTVVQLTPEQREQAIEAAARKNGGEPPINGLSGSGYGRQIHGEVGAMIGSNGSHAVYGSGVVPIGDGATAAFSFENSRYGHYHY